MKMKKHYLVIIVAVLWMVTPTLLLPASGKDCHQSCGIHSKGCGQVHAQACFGGHGFMSCDLSKCITDLSPDQKAKIRELGTACQKKLITLKADLKKLEIDMKTLFADHADKKKVSAKIDEITRIKAQMLKECYGCYLDVRRLLTDKQKEHLDKCHKNCAGGCCKDGGHEGHGKCPKGKHQCQGKCSHHKGAAAGKTTAS